MHRAASRLVKTRHSQGVRAPECIFDIFTLPAALGARGNIADGEPPLKEQTA
jgi:hypothetical protein